MTTLYLLHIDPPYKHACHYLGVSRERNITHRWLEHMDKRGAVLTRYARAAGSRLILARIWPSVPFTHERKIKGRGLAPLCPICRRQRNVDRQ